MDYDMLKIIAAFPLLFFLLVLVDRFTQSANDYRNEIIEELKRSGYELVTLKLPPMFHTGPFSFIRLDLFRSQSGTDAIKGNKTRYRIVEYKTKGGWIQQSWIRIDIKGLKVSYIKWIPSL